MIYRYRIHALTVALPFTCAELDPASATSGIDVTVSAGSVPQELGNAVLRDPDYDVTPEAFLLRGGPRSARFLVEHGATITFQRAPGCEDALFLHLLLYQAMAALLRQRSLFVLHGSSALSPSGAVIVAGESGAGKSTTVAALTSLGWPLHSEDVTALRLNDSNGVEALPGATHIHLFEASASALALSIEGLTQHDWHRFKVAVPVAVLPKRCPEPVRRIVLLRQGSNAGLRIERPRGHAKLILLTGAYGPLLPAQFPAVNPIISQLMIDTDMLVIERDPDQWTLNDVVSAISEDIA